MARLSEQIIAGLTRPSFSRGMFEIGQSIGRVPGQMRQQRERREEEERLKTEELTRRGLFSNAITGTLTPEVMQERLQEPGVTAQDLVLAQEMQTAGQQRAREAEERRLEPIQQRGRGRLKALAMNKEFNPQDANMLNGYLGMASAMKVPEDEAMDILVDARQSGNKTEVKVGTYQTMDENKHQYYLSQRRDQKGGGEMVYYPIGNAPAYIPGEGPELEPTGGAYNLAIGEKVQAEVEEAGLTQRVENFEDFREEQRPVLASSYEGIINANTMKDALSEMRDTGGALRATGAKLEGFLGVAPTDDTMFNILAKRKMISMLKQFGPNPTEGERKAAEELVESLQLTKEVNEALIDQFLAEMTRRVERLNFLLDPDTTTEKYDEYVKNQYETVLKSGQKRKVRFEDID